MKDWDNKVSLVKIKENYSIEEAQNLVLESLKPLGSEYTDMIKRLLKIVELITTMLPIKEAELIQLVLLMV